VLIANATRGYLASPAEFGTFNDGSRRRLLRIPRYGHVDVIYSPAARRAVLEWLRASLQLTGEVELSPARYAWVAAGAFSVLAVLALGGPDAKRRAAAAPRRTVGCVGTAALPAFWLLGLAFAPYLAHALPITPAQEGQVVLGLLGSETVAVLAAALAVPTVRRRLAGARRRSTRGGGAGSSVALLRTVGAAAVWATAASVAFALLLWHLYRVAALSAPRLLLLVLFAAAALPLFALLGLWLSALAGRAGPLALAVLAAATAAAAPFLFERMAVLPVYAVAASIALLAAYRAGTGAANATACAVFGTLVHGWTTSTVCALF